MPIPGLLSTALLGRGGLGHAVEVDAVTVATAHGLASTLVASDTWLPVIMKTVPDVAGVRCSDDHRCCRSTTQAGCRSWMTYTLESLWLIWLFFTDQGGRVADEHRRWRRSTGPS